MVVQQGWLPHLHLGPVFEPNLKKFHFQQRHIPLTKNSTMQIRSHDWKHSDQSLRNQRFQSSEFQSPDCTAKIRSIFRICSSLSTWKLLDSIFYSEQNDGIQIGKRTRIVLLYKTSITTSAYLFQLVKRNATFPGSGEGRYDPSSSVFFGVAIQHQAGCFLDS